MHAARRLLAPLGIATLPVLLAGCIVITRPRPVETLPVSAEGGRTAAPATATPPAARPSSVASTPSANQAEIIECGDGGDPTIEGTEQSFRITGTCAELTAVGTGLAIDASAATIGTLRVSGDRISVRVPAADAVVVDGDDASVTSAAGIGRLEIDGDRTVTEATTGIPSVTVRGRDNTVRSGAGVGSAVVTGSGNTIR